jgi:GTPase SAR1 family protein
MKSARPGRVVLCGESRSGKTSLFRALQGESFLSDYEPTALADHYRRINPADALPNVPELNVWDVGGDAASRPYARVYIRGADVVLVCTDAVLPPQLNGWLSVIRTSNYGMPEPTIAIVRTKKDLAIPPAEERAFQTFLQQKQCEGFVVSAQSSEGVPEMIHKLYEMCQQRKTNPPKIIPEPAVGGDTGAKSCCSVM